MTITLTVGALTVALDPDLYWSDEFRPSVVQSVTPSLTGAAIVEQAQWQAALPITLVPDPDDSDKTAWMARADLDVLRGWANELNRPMVLSLRGQLIDVMFRYDGDPLEVVPLVHYSDVQPTDWYRVRAIRLMTL